LFIYSYFTKENFEKTIAKESKIKPNTENVDCYISISILTQEFA
jgi:hypothetical protein